MGHPVHRVTLKQMRNHVTGDFLNVRAIKVYVAMTFF